MLEDHADEQPVVEALDGERDEQSGYLGLDAMHDEEHAHGIEGVLEKKEDAANVREMESWEDDSKEEVGHQELNGGLLATEEIFEALEESSDHDDGN